MENRKDKRFGERNKVLIAGHPRVPETGASFGIHARTRDISISGVQICTKSDLPVGGIIQVAIDLDGDARPLRLEGKVIWTRKSRKPKKFDIGVEFLHSSSTTILSLIKHFYGKPVGKAPSVRPATDQENEFSSRPSRGL